MEQNFHFEVLYYLVSFFAVPVDTDSNDDDTDEEVNSGKGASDDTFGLKPPSLIKQLKNILEQYPDNGQIIKVREHSCVTEI